MPETVPSHCRSDFWGVLRAAQSPSLYTRGRGLLPLIPPDARRSPYFAQHGGTEMQQDTRIRVASRLAASPLPA